MGPSTPRPADGNGAALRPRLISDVIADTSFASPAAMASGIAAVAASSAAAAAVAAFTSAAFCSAAVRAGGPNGLQGLMETVSMGRPAGGVEGLEAFTVLGQHSGMLWKRSRYLGQWRQRYMLLEKDGLLLSYLSPTDATTGKPASETSGVCAMRTYRTRTGHVHDTYRTRTGPAGDSAERCWASVSD